MAAINAAGSLTGGKCQQERPPFRPQPRPGSAQSQGCRGEGGGGSAMGDAALSPPAGGTRTIYWP